MPVNYQHNTSEITLGNGELLYNTLGIGYLNGDDAVKFKGGYDLEKFKAGIPKTTKAIFNKESSMELTAPFMQINPGNFALGLGGLALTQSNGAPASISSAEAKTFAPWPAAPGFEAIVCAGPAVTGLVVKNVAENSTFVDGVDYHLDAPTGIIYRLPGGSIPSGGTVHLTAYGYTPPSSVQMDFGSLTQLAEAPVLFRHVRPDHTLVEIYMDKAVNSKPLELDFSAGKLIVMNVNFEAIYSEEKGRLGYIKFTPNGSLATPPVYS